MQIEEICLILQMQLIVIKINRWPVRKTLRKNHFVETNRKG